MFAKIKKLINSSASPDNVAVELKKQGDVHVNQERYEQAIECYRQALNRSPAFFDALIAIGFALSEKGLGDEATQYLNQALSIKRDNVDAYFMLGNIARSKGDLRQDIENYIRVTNINPTFEFAYRMLFEVYQTQGNTIQAKSVLDNAIAALPAPISFLFERAGLYFAEKDYPNTVTLLLKLLTLSPDNVACHTNLAKTYMQSGQDAAAIPHLEHLIKLNVEDAGSYQDLGNIYLKLGRKLDALHAFKEVIRIEPDSPLKHLVAAFSGATTSTAPADYVEKLFDHYAENFDSHLTQKLHYHTPTLLVSLIESEGDLAARKLEVLDLGCGTGLFGRAIAPFAARIVGVDLSQKMLEKAASINLYQRLEHNDLLGMMRAEPDASYDLIAAADVFVYIGALDELVVEAKRLLRHNGIFAFSAESLEALPESKSMLEPQDFLLNDTGRYAHSISYLNMLAKKSGFKVLDIKEEPIRLNEDKPVIGYLSVWLV